MFATGRNRAPATSADIGAPGPGSLREARATGAIRANFDERGRSSAARAYSRSMAFGGTARQLTKHRVIRDGQ